MDSYGKSSYETTAIINAIRKEPALWDTQHPMFRDLGYRDRLVEDIGFRLRVTGAKVEWALTQILHRRSQECKSRLEHQYSQLREGRNATSFQLMDGGSFLPQRGFVGDDVDLRPHRQLNPFVGHGSKERNLNEKTYMLQRNNKQDLMPWDNAMNRQCHQQIETPWIVSEQHVMNERKRTSSVLPKYNDLQSQNKRKRKWRGSRRQNGSSYNDTKIISIKRENNSGHVKKMASEDTHTKDNKNVVQGKSSSKITTNSEHNVEKANGAVSNKLSAKNDETGIGNEMISDYMDLFRNLLPCLKSFAPIQKLKVKNKIQQVILNEYRSSTKDIEESSVVVKVEQNDNSLITDSEPNKETSN